MNQDITYNVVNGRDTSGNSVKPLFEDISHNFKSPNCNHSHLSLPDDVLKVVIRLLSLSNGTCQDLGFASNSLKYVELGSCGRMLSIVLLYHWFCCMALLKSSGSIHNISKSSGFFTGTMELIHSVYSFTYAVMPKFCSLLSSAL